jgi:hypothetical protein
MMKENLEQINYFKLSDLSSLVLVPRQNNVHVRTNLSLNLGRVQFFFDVTLLSSLKYPIYPLHLA